jgi:C-terminal processing protease CtpA/Prc
VPLIWGAGSRITELRVIDVLPDSEAANKGIKVGDALVAVDMKAAQVCAAQSRYFCSRRTLPQRLRSVILCRALRFVTQTRESSEMLAMIRGARGTAVRLDFRRCSGRHLGLVS